MKTFNQIRKDTSTIKKIDGVPVAFKKVSNGVAVSIDGEVLDVYPTQSQADKMATEFIKQLKALQ